MKWYGKFVFHDKSRLWRSPRVEFDLPAEDPVDAASMLQDAWRDQYDQEGINTMFASPDAGDNNFMLDLANVADDIVYQNDYAVALFGEEYTGGVSSIPTAVDTMFDKALSVQNLEDDPVDEAIDLLVAS